MKEIVTLFTHTDLDGVACSVLIHLHYRHRDAIAVQYCEYSNIDQKVNDYMDTLEYAQRQHALPEVSRTVYITDISIKPETAARLDQFASQWGIELHLLDHHATAVHLSQYPWATIHTTAWECGASMLYQHIRNLPVQQWIPASAVRFVESVRQYDTWEFDKNKETNADNLNLLLKLLGSQQFEMEVSNHFVWHPERPYLVCEQGDLYEVVRTAADNRSGYLNCRSRDIRKFTYNGYVVGLVFAEQHISRLGHHVLTQNKDVDICAIVNFPISVSLRTLRDDIHLGKDIAAPLGGGGHQKAAAFRLPCHPVHLIQKITGFADDDKTL